MAKIENLSKILLSIHAGTMPDTSDLSPEPIKFDFIFGLGTAGLTPFEYELSEKSEGDELSLQIRAEDIPQIFEHLRIPLPPIADPGGYYHLKIRIDSVAKTCASEVVKAMAELAGCGGDECGCGCGGHH
jgi:hypothetical protein